MAIAVRKAKYLPQLVVGKKKLQITVLSMVPLFQKFCSEKQTSPAHIMTSSVQGTLSEEVPSSNAKSFYLKVLGNCLEHKEVKGLAQGHRASMCQRRDLNPALFGSSVALYLLYHDVFQVTEHQIKPDLLRIIGA